MTQSPNNTKVPVSTRALIARLNRKMLGKGAIKSSRGTLAAEKLGQFFLVDGSRVLAHHVDLEELGRREGVLKPFEKCVE